RCVVTLKDDEYQDDIDDIFISMPANATMVELLETCSGPKGFGRQVKELKIPRNNNKFSRISDLDMQIKHARKDGEDLCIVAMAAV
ncbi:MAG TPA: hypothetical protein V6C97_03290, partial [Oculatellaceae cyanobacterium]